MSQLSTIKKKINDLGKGDKSDFTKLLNLLEENNTSDIHIKTLGNIDSFKFGKNNLKIVPVRIRLKSSNVDRKFSARMIGTATFHIENQTCFFLDIENVFYRSDKVGEKMNISEKLLILHEKKESPYQTYEYPISLSDVEKAYKRFNKELFGNHLPDCRLKWASLAKNFYGKYHHKFNDDGTAKDRLITLATVLQNDNERFEDTLIHEMIHCWQWFMVEKTGDNKYMDDEGFGTKEWFFNPEKDKHKRGHGQTFHGEMKRINALGYKVTIEGDMQVEKELVKPVYAIIFSSSTDRGVFVYSIDDPKNKMEDIIANLEELAGTGFFTSYVIIKTTDTVANTGLRLTGSFELPKNSKNIYTNSEAVSKYLSNSKLSVLVGGSDIAPTGDLDQSVSPEDVQLLQGMHKWRSSDFKQYLITFLNNSKKYSGLITTDAYKANNWSSELSSMNWEYPKPIKGIPKETIEAVRKDWMNISDIEIKPVFKYSASDVYRAISSKDKKLDSKFISGIESKYDSEFKGRVSMDRFKSIFYKVVLSDLKKKFKKYGEDFNEKEIENVIRSTLFKNTILESRQNLSKYLLEIHN